MNRYPFTPYPTSWFRVARSEDVVAGEAKPISAFGERLVLYRGASGVVRVTAATCPHLGADLASGGRVVGDDLACPFHGWRFGAAGRCVAIPYCERIPPKARLRAYPVREVNGLVFVWYDANGEPPHFPLPQVTEVGSAGWSRPHHLRWKIRMHVQEIAENAVDFGHFAEVHAYLRYPSNTALEVDEHRFRVSLDAPRRVLGHVGPTSIAITYHGMGCAIAQVHSERVQLIAILTPTPIDAEHVDVQLSLVFKKSGSAFMDLVTSTILPRDIRADFAKDIPIWENKAYLERPALCAEDGPISTVRKWARQFYPASLVSASDVVRATRSAAEPSGA